MAVRRRARPTGVTTALARTDRERCFAPWGLSLVWPTGCVPTNSHPNLVTQNEWDACNGPRLTGVRSPRSTSSRNERCRRCNCSKPREHFSMLSAILWLRVEAQCTPQAYCRANGLHGPPWWRDSDGFLG